MVNKIKNTTIIIISYNDNMFTHCDEICEIRNKNFNIISLRQKFNRGNTVYHFHHFREKSFKFKI